MAELVRTGEAPELDICDLFDHVGEYATIKGWLRNRRSSGKIHFLLVRDGTGEVQCVVRYGQIEEDKFELADHIGLESSIIVTGEVVADPRSPVGVEIRVTDYRVFQDVEDYPIGKKEHGVGFLLKHRHLWLRSPKQWAVARIRDEVQKATRDFFYARRFVNVDTPIFTPAACEGTTTLFEVDYHGDTAYLSQSGQLYLEAAIMSLKRCYCFGPVFRAEKSKTRRHLLEFWMVEAEAAWMEFEENLRLQEDYVTYLVERVLENRKRELEILERDTSSLERVRPPFPRITYEEAVGMIRGADDPEVADFEGGSDFGAPQETWLAAQFDRPVFVTNFPAEIKAFYMKRDPERPDTVLGADLLAPEGYGEIIGGSQREDDYETLLARIREHNLPEEAFQWYLDLRRYGTVPHGGFGLGIERTVAWLSGREHVRETIAFPRMLHQLYP